MVEPQASLWRRILKIQPGISLGWWCYERIANNWVTIIAFLGGGGVMTYLASISEILSGYGPVAWGGVGIISALLMALAYFVISTAKLKNAAAYYIKLSAEKPLATVNPLRQHFNREKINIADFYAVYSELKQHKDKIFTECDFYGPGVIVFHHECSINSPLLISCDLVMITNADIYTGVFFSRSVFRNCRFINVTLFLARNLTQQMVEESQRRGTKLPTIIGFNEQAREPPNQEKNQDPRK